MNYKNSLHNRVGDSAANIGLHMNKHLKHLYLLNERTKIGDIVIQPKYNDAYDFTEGLAPVSLNKFSGLLMNNLFHNIHFPNFYFLRNIRSHYFVNDF